MASGKSALCWDQGGSVWPNRLFSRFVTAGGIDWHVQQFGKGPPALLIHGTGASTHSWAWLAPYLSDRLSLTLIDLPGHAFTSSAPSSMMTLPAMSSAVGSLLKVLDMQPAIVIGHSAGAAILARMALDGLIAPRTVVSINGALMPFPGFSAHIFPAMAKMLFINPLTPRILAWRAQQAGTVERLIEGTGSNIPELSLEIYRQLFHAPGHVAGALSMMANWDLVTLNRALPSLKPRLLQIVGSNDRAVLPDQAFQLQRRFADAGVHVIRGPGHLAHEEAPEQVAPPILCEIAALETA